MTRRFPKLPTLILTTLILMACTATPSPSGRWIGSVDPTTSGPTCIRTRGVLELKSAIVTFAPNEGTWILQGTLDSDGSLYADHSQLGADKKPYETVLHAHWTPQSITGTYTTPRCSFVVSLERS